MSELNVLSASDLNSEMIDNIIDQLGDNEIESAVIMGFANNETDSDKIEAFSNQIKERLAKRAEERARKDEPESSGNLGGYTSLIDMSDDKRKQVLAAITLRAIIGKSKGLNNVLVSNEFLKDLD